MSDKRISVIMGVYNCGCYLRESIDSLLAQTYTDFELIMCEDGSSDDTYDVAREYADRYPDKIVLLRNERNLGLNETLNKCLAVAKGELIARMDGDDIAVPDRFEKEVAFLDSHPEISVVSSDMILFDEQGRWGRTHSNPAPAKRDLVHGTPFSHPPCMVRREAYEAVGGYSTEKRTMRVEDYDLWVRMYEHGFVGANITEPLHLMRDGREARSRRKFKYRINETKVRAYAVKHLGLPFWMYVYALRPILVGLMPPFIYKALHKRNLKETENDT